MADTDSLKYLVETVTIIPQIVILTRADVYYGRGQAVLARREKIKMQTTAASRQMHYDNQARNLNPMSGRVS